MSVIADGSDHHRLRMPAVSIVAPARPDAAVDALVSSSLPFLARRPSSSEGVSVMNVRPAVGRDGPVVRQAGAGDGLVRTFAADGDGGGACG